MEEMFAAGGPLESYILVDACGVAEYVPYEGKAMAEVAAAMDKHITDAFMDLNLASALEADFVTAQATSDDPDKVCEILDNPAIMAGTSDGGAHVKFYTGGHFSTDLIMWLVKEEGRYTLEQMHHKLSAQPAKAFGFDDRGTLEVGKAADLFVYDYDSLGIERGYWPRCELRRGHTCVPRSPDRRA